MALSKTTSHRYARKAQVSYFTRETTQILTSLRDYKCTLEIKDHSVQYMSSGLKIIIFWPLEKMPKIQGVSDVVIIRNVKVDHYQTLYGIMISQSLDPDVEWSDILVGKPRFGVPLLASFGDTENAVSKHHGSLAINSPLQVSPAYYCRNGPRYMG